MKNLKIEFWPEMGMHRYNMIITSYGNGQLYVAKPMNLEFIKHDEASPFPGATMTIDGFIAKDFLQAMADALDERGIKPSNKPPLENEMSAIKFHLEDMRKLVFEKK